MEWKQSAHINTEKDFNSIKMLIKQTLPFRRFQDHLWNIVCIFRVFAEKKFIHKAGRVNKQQQKQQTDEKRAESFNQSA